MAELPDLSKRFAVRHRVTIPGSAQKQVTDSIGVLLHNGEHTFTLELRDGVHVSIDKHDVIAGKRVPLRPAKFAQAQLTTPEELTRISTRGWPPTESVQLGNWLIRAADGFTKRANSAALLGAPDRPFDEAVRTVVEFYETRGLPPRLQTLIGTAEHDKVAGLSWRPDPSTASAVQVYVRNLDRPLNFDSSVTVDAAATSEWINTYAPHADPRTAQAVLEGPARVGFAQTAVGAICRVSLVGEWAQLACLHVPESTRRQAWGTRLIESCLAWASSHGATKAHLAVTAGNTEAVALYQSLGFSLHHESNYWIQR